MRGQRSNGKIPWGMTGAIAYPLIGLVTYIISAVDTWRSGGSAFINLLVNITLDAIMALMWPITWILWTFHHLIGRASPLDWLLR